MNPLWSKSGIGLYKFATNSLLHTFKAVRGRLLSRDWQKIVVTVVVHVSHCEWNRHILEHEFLALNNRNLNVFVLFFNIIAKLCEDKKRGKSHYHLWQNPELCKYTELPLRRIKNEFVIQNTLFVVLTLYWLKHNAGEVLFLSCEGEGRLYKTDKNELWPPLYISAKAFNWRTKAVNMNKCRFNL